MCVDYRVINAWTEKDTSSRLGTDEVWLMVLKEKYFVEFNLIMGYFKLNVKPPDR